jgi:hypothetical protein
LENKCPNCGFTFLENEEKCSTCGQHLGFPNVRAASQPEESDALRIRYEATIERGTARGAQENISRFEDAVRSSYAAIGCNIFRIRELIADPKVLYSNYYLTTSAQVRRLAIDEFDRHRRVIDSAFFGAYADKIVFAALSLDGKGLTSYGAFSIVLRDIAVAKRSSVLETNSYNFLKKHNIQPTEPIPSGYRSDWAKRALLAVAKLGDLITSATLDVEFPKLLLSQGAAREDDEYMEVHIFGAFGQNAVEAVRGNSSPKTLEEKAVVAVLKDGMAALGIRWIEDK